MQRNNIVWLYVDNAISARGDKKYCYFLYDKFLFKLGLWGTCDMHGNEY